MSTANDSLLQRESVLSLTKHQWGFDALFVLGKDEDQSFSYSPCAWDNFLEALFKKSALKLWAVPEIGSWRETDCWVALVRCFLLNLFLSKQVELWFSLSPRFQNSILTIQLPTLFFLVCFIQLMKRSIFSITKRDHISLCFWFACLFLTTSAFKSRCRAKPLSEVPDASSETWA